MFYATFWFSCQRITGAILAFGHGDVSNVAKAVGRAIYKIDTGIYKISLLNEIELVSLQAISYQYKFTAADFFNIDNRLLVAMVQAILTYYVIMVQLSPK
ncbi:unnamed protein product [Callosobruchus maculatus]|uniref:Uncharacterized protein n=1 Tax=Callosobruchus maculatus TaxID=64391 RepID=A0A653CLR6_CALMS|nr:unnamed protein product [Callosobruchus maculatus]